MQDLADLLSAVSGFAWPLLVLVAIALFRSEIKGVIDSARSRGIKLKVGGQELTIDEANEQQRTLIADLQSQVVSLREAIEGQGVRVAAASEGAEMMTGRRRSALWVDDNPKNNSYLIEQLNHLGVEVDLALATVDGLERFARKKYDVVLSDMGRAEQGTFQPTAGLSLVAQIRKADKAVPVVFVTTSAAVSKYHAEADQLGARITNSPTEVLLIFREVLGT